MKRFDTPFIGVVDCLSSHARWRPDHTALVCGEERLSYGELNRRISKVANGLTALGLGKGDKVALLMNNGIEMVQTIFGILKAGAVVVPLSTMVPGDVLAMMVNDSEAKVLVVGSQELQATLQPYIQDLKSITHRGFISLGFEKAGWQPYDAWLEGCADDEPGTVFDPEDEFSIIYSSGTTGVPKGIVHSHVARQNWVSWLIISLRMHPGTVTVLTTPLYTTGTWTTFLPSLVIGGTVVIMPKYDVRLFLELVQKEKATHSLMIPTQYIMTLSRPDFDQYDVSSIEVLVSGSAPLRAGTKNEMVKRFSCSIIEIYGNSEGIGTMLYLEEGDGKIGSVGKPPSGFDIRIIDDEGRELPRGVPGEIAGYAVGLMREYHKLPDKTAECIWYDERGRTYLKTGDVGRLDDDDFLYILDRKKDMIVSGGINIFATDIEEIVLAHPDVSDVAVIAVPHEKWGETPLALVIPATGGQASGEEIMGWANARLAKYQRVTGIEFREDFPRNTLGKVLKRELREPYWRSC